MLAAAGLQARNRLTLGTEHGLPQKYEVRDLTEQSVKLYGKGGTTNYPLSFFSKEVQKKITGWASDKVFESSRFSVRFHEKEKSITVPNGHIDLISYEIVFKNRSAVPLKAISVEYNIFYQYRLWNKEDNQYIHDKKILTLAPGQTKTIRTKQVQIRKEKHSRFVHSDSSGDPDNNSQGKVYSTTKDRMEGIHLYLTKVGQNGALIRRTCSDGFPPKKKYWSEYSDSSEKKPVTTN